MIELLEGVIVPYKNTETKIALLGNIENVLGSGMSGTDITSLLSKPRFLVGTNQAWPLTPRQIAELTMAMDCCPSPYATTEKENLRVAKIQEVLEIIKNYDLSLDYRIFLGFAMFGREEPNSKISPGFYLDTHEVLPSIFNQVSYDKNKESGFYLSVFSNAVVAYRLLDPSFTVRKEDLSVDVFRKGGFPKGDTSINCLEGQGKGLYTFGYDTKTNSFVLGEDLKEKFHVFVSDKHYKREGN